jgi:hypothetical protein
MNWLYCPNLIAFALQFALGAVIVGWGSYANHKLWIYRQMRERGLL